MTTFTESGEPSLRPVRFPPEVMRMLARLTRDVHPVNGVGR